jgi:hypothetical protein
MNKIPGLISITEQPDGLGGTRLVFEIEDDRSDAFFLKFGLAPGDEEGFNTLVVSAINAYIAEKTREIDNDRRAR